MKADPTGTVEAKTGAVTFQVILLIVNVSVLGLAGLFLGSQRPAGTAGHLLAFACVLGQIASILSIVRSRHDRRRSQAANRGPR